MWQIQSSYAGRVCQKSPIFNEKSPIFYEKSPIFDEKSPIFNEKNSLADVVITELVYRALWIQYQRWLWIKYRALLQHIWLNIGLFCNTKETRTWVLSGTEIRKRGIYVPFKLHISKRGLFKHPFWLPKGCHSFWPWVGRNVTDLCL